MIYIFGISQAPLYITVTGVFGLVLVGLYAYSVGMFASSLTSSYLLTLLIGGTILLLIDVGGFMGGLLPSPAKEIVSHMHGFNQYLPFTRGLIPFRGTVFFISLIILFLFGSVKVLESRRWRGQ